MNNKDSHEDNRFLRAYAEHIKEKEINSHTNITAGRFECLRSPDYIRYPVRSEHTSYGYDNIRNTNTIRNNNGHEPYRENRIQKQQPVASRPNPFNPFPELSKHTFNNTTEEKHTLKPVQVPHKHILPESAITICDTPLSEITSLGFKNGECVKNTLSERNVVSTTKVVYSSWADVMKTTYVFDN